MLASFCEVGGRQDLGGKAYRNGPEQRGVWPRFAISDAQFRSRLVVLNGPPRDWAPANHSTAAGSVAPPCVCSRPCSATVPATGHRQQRCGTFSGDVHWHRHPADVSTQRHKHRNAATLHRLQTVVVASPDVRREPLADVVVDAVTSFSS